MSGRTILKAKIVGVQITVLGVERLTNLISTSRHTLISYPLWPVLRKIASDSQNRFSNAYIRTVPALASQHLPEALCTVGEPSTPSSSPFLQPKARDILTAG